MLYKKIHTESLVHNKLIMSYRSAVIRNTKTHSCNSLGTFKTILFLLHLSDIITPCDYPRCCYNNCPPSGRHRQIYNLWEGCRSWCSHNACKVSCNHTCYLSPQHNELWQQQNANDVFTLSKMKDILND